MFDETKNAYLRLNPSSLVRISPFDKIRLNTIQSLLENLKKIRPLAFSNFSQKISFGQTLFSK